jgi:hypothetical protein
MGPLDVIRGPALVAVSVAEGALSLATDVLGAARRLLEGEAQEAGRDFSPQPARYDSAPSDRAERRQAGPPPTPQPAPEPPLEEDHVDEGAVVVAEVAEAGAEEGAGAELEIEEPWEGYDRMSAEEVGALLEEASREALAAVELYEATTRNRQAVLETAERRLRELTPPGSSSGNGINS